MYIWTRANIPPSSLISACGSQRFDVDHPRHRHGKSSRDGRPVCTVGIACTYMGGATSSLLSSSSSTINLHSFDQIITFDISLNPNHTLFNTSKSNSPFQSNQTTSQIKMQFSAVILAFAAMAGAVSAE